QARLGDDVIFEIQDALEFFQRHVQQQADARGQRLHEPDMRNRRGELDMAHALAADFLKGDFDAALFADDAAIFHALVLASEAFVIADRTKDARAEQTVTLRLERPVVDRLRLLDFAEGPGTDAFRRGDRDANLIEALRLVLLIKDAHKVVHLGRSPDVIL